MFPEWVCKSDQNAVTQNRILAMSTIESIAVKLKVMALPTRASSSPNSRIRYYVLNCFKVGFRIRTLRLKIQAVDTRPRDVHVRRSGRRQAEINGEREARHKQTESIEG